MLFWKETKYCSTSYIYDVNQLGVNVVVVTKR